MTIQEKVQAALIGSDLVAGAIRPELIKARDTDIQKLGQKYIIHAPAVPSISTHCHGGIQSITNWPVYQVFCYGPSLTIVLPIATAVRKALGDYKSDQFRSFLDGEGAPEVDDLRHVVSVTLDFDIWENID